MLCDDRKREIAICRYPIQPTIFSYPSTKTAFVLYILEQLAIVAEQQAASVLWHTVKRKQKEKKQWEDIGKRLETGKSLSTDLGLDPRSSVALGRVDLWFGLLLAGRQSSASFPCSGCPAKRHCSHLRPSWFGMYLRMICVFVLPSDGYQELQQFAAYPDVLSCRAGEVQFAPHRQLWHSLVLLTLVTTNDQGGHRCPCSVICVSPSPVVVQDMQDEGRWRLWRSSPCTREGKVM